MKIKTICLNLFFLCLLTPIVGQTVSESNIPKIEFEKYTLPNGLDVILHIDRKSPVVHVNQWFRVGSANEKRGKTGFAHLFEHLMLQGSKNADKDYFTYVESIGANFNQNGANASTRQNRTTYFATVPSGNLENLLWLESDRLATLPEALTQEKLDNQRDVVRNERRRNLENTPFGLATKIINENLYPLGHPYAKDVYGSHEDLMSVTLDDAKEFFRTYYTPNNLSLVISGDFDIDEAKRLVAKYFGTIPPGKSLTRLPKFMPKLDSEKIVEVKDRVSTKRVYMVWHTPAFFDSGDAELYLAGRILLGGRVSRLYKALIENKIATRFSCYQNGQPLSGVFTISANLRDEVSFEDIENAITEEIARLAKEVPTDEELKRVKLRQEYRYVAGLESLGSFGGKSDLLNKYNTFLGSPDKFEEDLARYRNATKESIRKAVTKYLDTRNRLIVRYYPEKSEKPSQVATDRTKEPPLGKDKPFKVPEIKTVTLKNGLKIFVVERPEIPKVNVQLTTKAGSVADPVSKKGLSKITVNTMSKETKTRNESQLKELINSLGGSFYQSWGKQYVTINAEILKPYIGQSLDLMSDIVLNPTFPKKEVEQEKELSLNRLKQYEVSATSVANNTAYKIAFGENHPYTPNPVGLSSNIKNITREDVQNFHKTYWKPASSALVFVGDITLIEATDLSKKYFGSWSGGSAPSVTFTKDKLKGKGKVYLIDKPKAAQTAIYQIFSAPKRASEDYYPVSLANGVFGDGFGNRLNLNLREDKGYSYGVSAFPVHFTNGGVWFAAGTVQTDKTKESIIEFVREMKNLAGEKPISQNELLKAKLIQSRGFAQRFASARSITSQIIGLWIANLPISDLQKKLDKLEKLDLKTVNQTAAKYVVPSESSLVVVGDLSKIEAKIRELNLGEIVILEANEVFNNED